MIKKIDIDNIDKKYGVEALDKFRDGHSPDLDSIKVSAVILDLAKAVNQLIEQYAGMAELVDRMRNRSKPGPKPKNKISNVRG